MAIFKKSKPAGNPENGDVLGVYPEYMQVRALPERRYLKTSRLLAIVILINIGLMIMVSGLFTYYADRADVTIATPAAVHLFSIDPVRKVLVPAEYAQGSVPALRLMTESILRAYIKNRHEIVWDNAEMQNRWSVGGPIALFSVFKTVFSAAQAEADLAYQESRNQQFVRDVHLYDLKYLGNALWEGVFDIFDMPIPDSFDPLCACSDNGAACLMCKTTHAVKRQRFRVFIRGRFEPTARNLLNPLGYLITNYNLLYMPINPDEPYWDLPADLKPEL